MFLAPILFFFGGGERPQILKVIYAADEPNHMTDTWQSVTDRQTDTSTVAILVGAYARVPAFGWVHCEHV